MRYFYACIAILSFVLMITANYLSTSGIISWLDMRGLQNTFPFDYMPPGITFAVSWGIIYLLLTTYIISLIPKILKELTLETKREIHYFVLINFLNISWIIATVFKQYLISGIVIFLLCFTLLVFVKKFCNNFHKNLVFGVYLGWITVATFVLTVAQFVYMYNNSWALSNAFGTGILVFGGGVAGVIFWKLKNPYALFWSLTAIVIAGVKLYGLI